MQVTFHFDFGSPYAYLGWQRIRKYPERYAGATVSFVSVSAGHIFQWDGTSANATFPNQRRYIWEDGRRIAAYLDVPFAPPPDDAPGTFPVRSLDASRLHFLAAHHRLDEAWRQAVFLAYFEDALDISDPDVLTRLMHDIGLPGTATQAKEQRWKDALAVATQAAYDAGAPGVPFTIVEHDGQTERFWGQDRLAWVEERIAVPA